MEEVPETQTISEDDICNSLIQQVVDEWISAPDTTEEPDEYCFGFLQVYK